jgi:hypothetical protein
MESVFIRTVKAATPTPTHRRHEATPAREVHACGASARVGYCWNRCYIRNVVGSALRDASANRRSITGRPAQADLY